MFIVYCFCFCFFLFLFFLCVVVRLRQKRDRRCLRCAVKRFASKLLVKISVLSEKTKEKKKKKKKKRFFASFCFLWTESSEVCWEKKKKKNVFWETFWFLIWNTKNKLLLECVSLDSDHLDIWYQTGEDFCKIRVLFFCVCFLFVEFDLEEMKCSITLHAVWDQINLSFDVKLRGDCELFCFFQCKWDFWFWNAKNKL